MRGPELQLGCMQASAWLAQLLATAPVTALAWVHLLLLDLFVARCGSYYACPLRQTCL